MRGERLVSKYRQLNWHFDNVAKANAEAHFGQFHTRAIRKLRLSGLILRMIRGRFFARGDRHLCVRIDRPRAAPNTLN